MSAFALVILCVSLSKITIHIDANTNNVTFKGIDLFIQRGKLLIKLLIYIYQVYNTIGC